MWVQWPLKRKIFFKRGKYISRVGAGQLETHRQRNVHPHLTPYLNQPILWEWAEASRARAYKIHRTLEETGQNFRSTRCSHFLERTPTEVMKAKVWSWTLSNQKNSTKWTQDEMGKGNPRMRERWQSYIWWEEPKAHAILHWPRGYADNIFTNTDGSCSFSSVEVVLLDLQKEDPLFQHLHNHQWNSSHCCSQPSFHLLTMSRTSPHLNSIRK